MKRADALDLIKKHVANKNLLKHMLATEACMRRLGRYYQENEDEWAEAGLLHDLDYDSTKDDFSRHGLVTKEILTGYPVSGQVIEAIAAHPGHCARTTNMAKALYAADPLTGLIVAAALMHPERRLESVTADFVLNRFKEKHFARGASRQQIESCREIGLSLEEFVVVCLQAMQEISTELGL